MIWQSDDDLIKKLLNEQPLYVFAMQQEAKDRFQDVETCFCGVGKENATYALTKQIGKKRSSVVVNLGSVGSAVFAKDTVVCCDYFVQRDMDVTPLGIEKYQTPYAPEPAILKYGLKVSGLMLGLCGTGDNFQVNQGPHFINVVDMEAHSLALVCLREDIPFLCLKYITDGADGNAAADWNTALDQAAHQLHKTIETLKR
jgi:adenosylhomocysteine nucleosidase